MLCWRAGSPQTPTHARPITIGLKHHEICALHHSAYHWVLGVLKLAHQRKQALHDGPFMNNSRAAVTQAFNNPSTYVKAAKFQRLANAKEKELAALQTVREVTAQDRVDATVSTIKVIVTC